jgi:crotonobetainyl-CoA:carnitine CoA-transferase CaiB-like acyl-CoA transferase
MRVNLLGKNICYNTYKTKDGKFIALGDIEPQFWLNFCHAIKREDLLVRHYSTYQEGEEITESLRAMFSTKTLSEWVELMKEVDNCFTPVQIPDEVLKDPQLTERGMITKIADPKRGETTQLGFPTLFSEGLDYKRSPAPALGEHTLEVLKDLGYSFNEVESLKERGVI